MIRAKALRTPLGLNVTIGGFLGVWLFLAAFPLCWIVIMSFKVPVDALSSNPLTVILGPLTRATHSGLSVLDLVIGGVGLMTIYNMAAHTIPPLALKIGEHVGQVAGWLLSVLLISLGALVAVIWILPALLRFIDGVFVLIPVLDYLAVPLIGVTPEHYQAVWLKHGFYKNFFNSMIVTAGVVIVSLTVGTLAGYALSRTKSDLAFWLLIVALIFRALPQSVLVSGYLTPFINSREWLMPFWNLPVLGTVLHTISAAPPTLYGQPFAVIAVLVSINQPFTIWMLRSFFQGIPVELDEAARVDGCSHFAAFRRVIMPVMWPGVITTGLFAFLLAYNDYLVCAMLLDAQSQTMVPAITQFFNRETTSTDEIQAIAAAVSITAPLFLMVMVFQRQIVSGLTAGAVKG